MYLLTVLKKKSIKYKVSTPKENKQKKLQV